MIELGSIHTMQIVWISMLILLVVVALVVAWWFVWRKRLGRTSSGYAPPGHDLDNIET